MTDIDVRFQCGCVATVDVDQVTSPRCLTHNQRAAGVVKAPAPRFLGHATGPHAKTRHLMPMAVKVATHPMPLKAADASEDA